MRYLYSLIMYLLVPLVLVRLLLRSLKAPAYRARWAERFGFGPLLVTKGAIWVHAVSVGEVQAAVPVIKVLQQTYPQRPLVITTTTPTGSDQVRALFGDQVAHTYLPYDLPDAVARFLNRARPQLALIMETEVWPNLFYACHSRNIPLMMINARMSGKSARGYRRFSALTRLTLNYVTMVAAQAESDGERLIGLGVPQTRLKVTGNTKFDAHLAASLREQAEIERQAWGIQRNVWIAASTHEGEDAIMLEAHRKLLDKLPNALLVIVPRHPERFDRVAEQISAAGWRMARRSRNEPVTKEVQVYLADTMGELQFLFGTADVAFVGGSLIPIGGHNPIEPAAFGVPVLFGPHRFNFSDISSLLMSKGAAREVGSAQSLAQALELLLSNANLRQEWGEKGKAVVEANRGARDMVLQMIRVLLPS